MTYPHQPHNSNSHESGFVLSPGVAGLFGQPVVVVNAAALSRQPWANVRQDATQLINDMGMASARAQGLVNAHGVANPITVVNRLGETDARVYILGQQEEGGPPVAVGLLKVGKKDLFHWDADGRQRELRGMFCVLDFYVHEHWQRGGFGKYLFMSMLQNEGVDPSKLAYDRPSPKLIGFMRKHFGLTDYVPQQNKFVIFNQYFESQKDAGQRPASQWDSVNDRPLTARGIQHGRR